MRVRRSGYPLSALVASVLFVTPGKTRADFPRETPPVAEKSDDARAADALVFPDPLPTPPEPAAPPAPRIERVPEAPIAPAVVEAGHFVASEAHWRVDLAADASATYDDNVFISRQNPKADEYYALTPQLIASWGEARQALATLLGTGPLLLQQHQAKDSYLLARYAPTATLFTDNTGQDSLTHDAALTGRWETGRLDLNFTFRFQTLSAPSVDLGNRVNSRIGTILLDAAYKLSDKTSLDAHFSTVYTGYNHGLDSFVYSGLFLLDYHLLPKTTIGLGLGAGAITVSQGSDQGSEQLIAHLHYAASSKLAFDLEGGVEFRQISDSSDLTQPIFNMAAEYQPVDSTQLQLSASRRTEPSALFAGEDIERTSVDATVRQRFFQRLYLTATTGYFHARYVVAGGPATGRRDDFFRAAFGAELKLSETVTLRGSYEHQSNDSTMNLLGFSRNVATTQLSLHF